MHPLLALGLAYLAGSFPSAYLAGRAIKGVDLRTMGSGNLGATNVYRNLGAPAAIAVLLLDALKGALPVALLPGLLAAQYVPSATAELGWALAFGVAAILGHAKPIFLLWRGGGKGVATASGVFAVIAPVGFLVSFAVFLLVAWRTRIVSLGSILSAAALPPALVLTEGPRSPVFFAGCAISIFVIWSHRKNIARLRQGTEPRTFKGGAT